MPKPLVEKNLEIKERIAHLENTMDVHQVILNKFPDATSNSYGGFYSKSVNQDYNKTMFRSSSYALTLYLYHDLEYLTKDGKTETVRICSAAKQSYQLVWVGWNRIDHKPDTINFTNITRDFKKYKVKPTEELLGEIRLELMKYIKAHPQYKINETNLEPRLRKLLQFT